MDFRVLSHRQTCSKRAQSGRNSVQTRDVRNCECKSKAHFLEFTSSESRILQLPGQGSRLKRSKIEVETEVASFNQSIDGLNQIIPIS